MNQRVLTAREAFDDCLSFFEDQLQPAMKADSGGFEGDLTPGKDFEISLTVTHGALVALIKRYGPADFTFHSERNPIPSSTKRGQFNPLKDLYVELTIDFTPYGTIFGSSSNDNGGGTTEATKEEDSNVTTDIKASGPSPSPNAPSGPSLGEENGPSPAIA